MKPLIKTGLSKGYLLILFTLFAMISVETADARRFQRHIFTNIEVEADRNKTHEEYLNSRIATITKMTTFTKEEEAKLKKILKEYDEAKFKVWRERRDLYQTMRLASANFKKENEAKYKELINKLETLRAESHEAEENLNKELKASFTPEQVIATYVGLQGVNRRVGKGLRIFQSQNRHAH